MAKIVAGFGVPHNPAAPEMVRKGGQGSEVKDLYGAVEERVRKAELDAVIVFSSDHLSTFFLDNLPMFSIGVTDRTAGPNDGTVMPRYDVPIHEDLAAHIRLKGIESDFDLGITQEFELDHSFLVPLHFLTPAMKLPIVPVFLSGIVAPLPRSQRCYALGQSIRTAVESWPDDLRVGVIGSGSFTLDIGGDKGQSDRIQSYPDPAWTKEVADCLDNADVDRLVAGATAQQLENAGNVAGEILNWELPS
jgi:aromatic ring-opening dioxygenase catalytic subunit (LigB family)